MDIEKIKILAIDDNSDNLISLKALIKEAFPTALLLTALNGLKGLELAAAEDPDVILLDIVMPVMDGFEVCKKLKADKTLSDIPVVFVTAIKDDKESRIRALECGAEGFLAKPIDESELTAQVRAMVKIKAAYINKRDENKRLAALVEAQNRELKKSYTATLKLLEAVNKENKTREKSELKLVQNQELLTEAQRISHVGSWVLDLQTNIPMWSDEIYRIFGLVPHAIKPSFEAYNKYIHPDDREFVNIALSESVKNKTVFNIENRLLLDDGTVKYVNHRGVNTYDSNGKPLYSNGIIHDITERKRAEDAFRESEAKFRNIINLSPVPYALNDEEQNITYVNSAFIRIFGYDLNDIPTLADWWIQAYPDSDYRRWVRETWQDRLDKAKTEAMEFEPMELNIRCKDGSIKTALVSAGQLAESFMGIHLVILFDITELKHTQDIIVKNEQRLSDILKGTNVGTWEWNIQTGETIYNERWAEIIGYQLEDISPINIETWMKYSHPDDLIVSDELLKKHFKGDSDYYECESRMKHKNGDWIWILDRGRVHQRDREGKPLLMSGTHQDITERKQAEDKLKKSEERYRKLFNLASEGIIVLTIDGEIAEVNQSFAQMHGYTVDEIRGININDIDVLGEKTFDDRSELINSMFAGEVVHFESEHYHKDGYSICLSNTSSLITIADQQYFLAFHRDITERKQAEDKIREKDIEFRKLSANLPDMIYQFTRKPDGTYYIPIASEGIRNIFGCSPEDVVDDFTPISRVIHPDDAVRVISGIEYSAKHLTYFTCEFRVQIPDREVQWILSRSTPEKLSDGSITWYGFNANITDRKKVEQELITAKEQAEESDRLKSAFLANMSHEIRTPMNGILGFADLLKEPELTGEEQQAYIKIIEKSGARMLNIINDIVDISKIEAGMTEVKKKESNINEQIQYIYTFFKLEAETKGIKLLFKNTLPASAATIHTDREKLFAILTNLVKNALKYTDEGSIEFGYVLKPSNAVGDTIEMEFFVKDTGIGIPKDKQELIFERFIQADIEDKMARQGAGLGLSISKAYVEMLGGKIWVESEEGVGSTFYFTLPYLVEV